MSLDESSVLAGDAWRHWCERLADVGEAILADDHSAAPRDRAEGMRWLTRLLVFALRSEVEAGDPRFPRFVRYETPDNQWGGPNPDNLYLRARVDPRYRYRVWANVTGVRQAIVSLHEGDMQLGQRGVYGETSLDALNVQPDGRLDITLSADAGPDGAPNPAHRPHWTNRIVLHPSARLLTVRVYQSDWEGDAGPVFHIEREGAEGEAPPPLEPDALARALEQSLQWVEKSAGFWSAYTRRVWEQSTPNVPGPPRSAPGGADNILYGSCCWELSDDETLLLECDEPDAPYWGFSIHTLGWLESGDFADRQTSLSDRQTHVDSDGRVRIVLAHRDPGVPNWIDTEERVRGLLVYRWVFSRNAPAPSARVLSAAELRGALPADHPEVDGAARRRALARRREAACNRFP